MAVSKNVAEDMMNWLEADDSLKQVRDKHFVLVTFGNLQLHCTYSPTAIVRSRHCQKNCG